MSERSCEYPAPLSRIPEYAPSRNSWLYPVDWSAPFSLKTVSSPRVHSLSYAILIHSFQRSPDCSPSDSPKSSSTVRLSFAAPGRAHMWYCNACFPFHPSHVVSDTHVQQKQSNGNPDFNHFCMLNIFFSFLGLYKMCIVPVKFPDEFSCAPVNIKEISWVALSGMLKIVVSPLQRAISLAKQI